MVSFDSIFQLYKGNETQTQPAARGNRFGATQ